MCEKNLKFRDQFRDIFQYQILWRSGSQIFSVLTFSRLFRYKFVFNTGSDQKCKSPTNRTILKFWEKIWGLRIQWGKGAQQKSSKMWSFANPGEDGFINVVPHDQDLLENHSSPLASTKESSTTFLESRPTPPWPLLYILLQDGEYCDRFFWGWYQYLSLRQPKKGEREESESTHSQLLWNWRRCPHLPLQCPPIDEETCCVGGLAPYQEHSSSKILSDRWIEHGLEYFMWGISQKSFCILLRFWHPDW